MQASHDFKAECDQIDGLLANLSASDFSRETLFKSWTIGEIVEHLHLFNIAADKALESDAAFMAFAAKVIPEMNKGHQGLQRVWFGDTPAIETYQAWRDYYPRMAKRFAQADPEQRLKWFGPDMSAQSSIIARQMEHWAHAQAIFDLLGVERENKDRIRNVAHIGVTTYSWSHKVNGEEPPKPKPYVRLTAPSGAIWEWNDVQSDNRIEGDAVEFAQIVTQCRNIADTSIKTIGETATHWMAIAQCFAGPPETPPPPGTRRMGNA